MVKRNWLLDKWEADWRVDFSDVSGLSTAKESSITIPVIEQQGVSVLPSEEASDKLDFSFSALIF